MPPLKLLPRLLLPSVFLLTLWGWQEYYASLGETVDWPALAYLGLQTFFVNTPAVPQAPLLLTVMQFAAPGVLAAASLSWLSRIFRLHLRALGFRLSHRGRHRLILTGGGWSRITGSQPFPGGLHALVLRETAAVTTGLLRLSGASRARRIFLFPSAPEEAWDLLRALAPLSHRGKSRLPVTLFTDNLPDAALLRAVPLAQWPTDLFPPSRLEVTLADSREILTRRLAQAGAPHRHPRRGAEMHTQAPRGVIQWTTSSGTDLAGILTREVLGHWHYPSLANPRLTLIPPAGDPGLTGIPDISRTSVVNQLRTDSIKLKGLAPHTVYLLAPSLGELKALAQGWFRRARLEGFPPPQVLPVLLGSADAPLAGFASLQLTALEPEAQTKVWTLEEAFHWDSLVLGHETEEQAARVFHTVWLDNPGLTGAKVWDELSQDERDMNLRPARHLEIKLWTLGYAMTLEHRDTPDPGTTALGDKMKERIAGDPALEERLMRLEHNRWTAEKLLQGFLPLPPEKIPALPPKEKKLWIKHGKDFLKIHTDIAGFDSLDKLSKDKDKASFQIPLVLKNCPGLILSELPRLTEKDHA